MIQIDQTHAKGMDIDIPLRIFLSKERPVIRAPWFTIPMKKDKTVQELFLEQLRRNDIPYVLFNDTAWFFWTEQWCSYDYYLDEEYHEVKINLLVYRSWISKPSSPEEL